MQVSVAKRITIVLLYYGKKTEIINNYYIATYFIDVCKESSKNLFIVQIKHQKISYFTKVYL